MVTSGWKSSPWAEGQPKASGHSEFTGYPGSRDVPAILTRPRLWLPSTASEEDVPRGDPQAPTKATATSTHAQSARTRARGVSRPRPPWRRGLRPGLRPGASGPAPGPRLQLFRDRPEPGVGGGTRLGASGPFKEGVGLGAVAPGAVAAGTRQ